MKIVQGAMNRPVTVFMVTLAGVIFGWVALNRLPLNLLPDISYPTLTIQTEYPDAAPAEVEKLITEALEEAVSVVPGLRGLRSVSRAGVSEITLEFAWKTSMDYASLDVREKIDLVRLPEDASSPLLLRFDPNLDPVLRIGLYGDKDLVTLRHLGEQMVKKDLESLFGVASVRVRGGLEEEIHVEVDEGKLSALDLPIGTVSQFLQSQNLNAAGGRLRDREAEFLVRALNEFETVDDIAQTVVYEDGRRRVKLQDVATVTRGYKEREVISRVRGKEAVELALYKEGQANTVQVAKAVRQRMDWLEEQLPEGVGLQVLFDQSTFIEQSLNEVRNSAIVGGVLAVLVLYFFLRHLLSTMIIALVIPISIWTTFFVMQQFKVSLNIMSLGGLALGVGMLVDNAIVVLEAISRHRAEGMDPWRATREGASEVSHAVTASTLTTVAVFLPIIFVEGIAGQIFRDQALTVAASLLVSLIAALTLIPVLASLGHRPRLPAAAASPGQAEDIAGAELAAAEDAIALEPLPPSVDAAAPVPGRQPGRFRRALGRLLGPPLRALIWPLQMLWRFALRYLLRALAWPLRMFWRFALRYLLRALLWLFSRILRGVLWALLWLARSLFVLLPGGIIRIGRPLLRWTARFFSILLRPAQSLFDRVWNAIAAVYPGLLTLALNHRAETLAIALALGIGAFFVGNRLGVELVPPFSQGQFTFDLELPPGTPLLATQAKVARLEEEFAADPRIALFFASVGESPELGSARQERRENLAQINISIADAADRGMETRVVEKIRRELAAYPEIHYTLRRPSYFSFRTPIEVQVFGYDIDQLRSYADSLTLALSSVQGLRDVRSSLESGNPEVQVRFSRDRMAALDLNLEDVSRTLRNKIHGDVATRLKERDRQIDIRVRKAEAGLLDISQVRDLIVSQVEGIPIPLAAVAEVNLGRGPSQITHIGQQRAAVIEANLVGRDLGSATRDILAVIAGYPAPANLDVSLGGQNEEVATSYRSLAMAVCLAIFMVYLVMASQFESFLHPLVILVTVPLGMVGVILALLVTGTAISIVVLIGAVMLTGIVVNNAIVLVDFINQRRRAGLPKRAAILDAGRARLRPIIMTTLTTVLGLLPMALGVGEGAEIRAPMAVAVIGGLALATLLTLVVIPVLYETVDRKP